MNFEHYKVSYHVCVHDSLTAAAQELCISQPAVNQAVRQLEEETRTKLFFRTSKGMQLTREEELLYRYAEPGVEELSEGGKMPERMLNMDVGEVWTGASDTTLQLYLLPYLEQSHREYPKIKVSVANASTPETTKSPKEGRIDSGVVIFPFASRGIVRQFQVKAMRNVSIAGSSFQELEGRKLEYKELEVFPCIVLEENTDTRILTDAFLAQQGTLFKPEFELAISDMTVQLARRSMGTGCVMEGFTEDVIIRGEVFRLKFKQEMSLRHACVVTGELSLISVPGCRPLNMMVCDQTAAEQPVGGR